MKLIKMHWSLQHSQHKVAGIGMTQPAHLSHGARCDWLVVAAASMDLADESYCLRRHQDLLVSASTGEQ